MSQILDRITDVFRDAFDDNTLVLTRSTTARDVDGWDSMMQVSLVIGIEKAFGMRFSAADISNLETVGDLEDLVQRRLGPAKG
jgi:acyl carrier protein